MNLNEMLGIENTPMDRNAESLLDNHHAMLDALKAIREERGLTVEDVAERLQRKASKINAIENGNNRNVYLLHVYCLAIGATIVKTPVKFEDVDTGELRHE